MKVGPKPQPEHRVQVPEEDRKRLLASFPSRRAGLVWDIVDTRAVIALPKRYSPVEKFLARFVPGPEVVFVTLDEIGSAAWQAADGSRTVADVAADLGRRFGAKAEPADDRALAFFVDVARRGFADVREAAHHVDNSGRGFTPARGFRALACKRCGQTHPIKAPVGARYQCPRCGGVNKVRPETV